VDVDAIRKTAREFMGAVGDERERRGGSIPIGH
jgi:hypothetical protein